MSYSNQNSPIKVYCTVDRKHIIETEEGSFCTKCQKSLLDLNLNQAPEKADAGRCGIYRTFGITTIASTMALAGCKEKTSVVGCVELPPAKVGKVMTSKDEYPIAEFVPNSETLVFSPYTGKQIDVSNIQAGTLVMDPDFHVDENKYFRMPQKDKRDELER